MIQCDVFGQDDVVLFQLAVCVRVGNSNTRHSV